PIYEYRCLDCRKKVSIFFRTISSTSDPKCPECGGTNLERLFSRVVVRRGGGRTAESDDFDSAPFGFDDDTDPREIARWTRQMSAQMGEPLDADLDSALTDLERGADPDEVMGRLAESELPPSSEE